jgi:hypothetical protein
VASRICGIAGILGYAEECRTVFGAAFCRIPMRGDLRNNGPRQIAVIAIYRRRILPADSGMEYSVWFWHAVALWAFPL